MLNAKKEHLNLKRWKLTVLFHVSAATISAVDVINGLGACLGMDVIKVKGATGYIDTNYEGKADAALQALKDGYDFVYVHVESMDEVSHAQDLALKMKTIEDFDARLIGRVRKKRRFLGRHLQSGSTPNSQCWHGCSTIPLRQRLIA